MTVTMARKYAAGRNRRCSTNRKRLVSRRFVPWNPSAMSFCIVVHRIQGSVGHGQAIFMPFDAIGLLFYIFYMFLDLTPARFFMHAPSSL
ncbi:MAG TPA: hypothetical protein VMB81_31280 [Candidatus Sulfotelmatobacter sp.]|nr:hypothetical protein [Candidatus Sulfotelmatobacter sp.]